MFIKLGEPLMHSFDRLVPRSLLSAAVLAVGLATGGAVALAQEEAAQEEAPHAEDPVVATVNGSEIHYSDVIRSAQNLPAQYQQNLAQIFPALVQRLIDMRLMEDRGREEGLADDEQVRRLEPLLMHDHKHAATLSRRLQHAVRLVHCDRQWFLAQHM